AVETALLETAMCIGDLIEGDPLGDARPDGVGCQHPEEPLQVFPKPDGVSCAHCVDGVDSQPLGRNWRRFRLTYCLSQDAHVVTARNLSCFVRRESTTQHCGA